MPLLLRRWFAVAALFCGLNHAASASPIDPNAYPGTIRVACVGASITKGAGAHPGMGYSDQLQRILGSKWEVKNFGVSGATMTKKGNFPYWNLPAFKAARDYQPDVVIILLGTNDTKPVNWMHHADFLPDCEALVESFEKLPSHARVFLCRLPPIFPPGNYGMSPAHLKEELTVIDAVGQAEKIDLVDVNTPLQSHPELFPDRVHPNDAGAGIIAHLVAQALTGKS
jgi:acyl-CoA thioesterase-1